MIVSLVQVKDVIDLKLRKDDGISKVEPWGEHLIIRTLLDRLFILSNDLVTLVEII